MAFKAGGVSADDAPGERALAHDRGAPREVRFAMQDADSDVDMVRRHELNLLLPVLRSAPGSVAELLADNFIEFGGSGRVYSKQDAIDALAQEPSAERHLSDVRCAHISNDVILVTYRLFRRSNSSSALECSLRSSIWRRSDGRWQMEFHQGTPTAF